MCPRSVLVCLLSGAGLALAGCGGGQAKQLDSPSLPAVPTLRAALPAAAIPPGDGYLVARVLPGHSLVARARPRGEAVGRLSDKTEFGGPQILSVRATARNGRWLAVSTPLRDGTRPEWIRSTSRDLALGRTRYSIRVRLGERTLEVRRGGRVLRSMAVAVGRAGTSTPTGRFAVTDSLKGAPFGPAYGCCILAISARQPNLPPGWIGDDRVAIHGTAAGVAGSGSNGCIRLADGDLRWLTRRVRLGMPVLIES